MPLALTVLALAAASVRRLRRARDCSVRSMAVRRLDMRDLCSADVQSLLKAELLKLDFTLLLAGTDWVRLELECR